MQRVQGCGSGAGHPSGVRARQGVRDFLGHHASHQVGHGPHAFADLGAAAQTAGQAGQHITALVGGDPGAGFHFGLADHGPGVHDAVNLVTGAVQKPGIDKGHAAAGGCNTGLQVDAGAALFVHDAQLDGARRQTQQGFHPAEQFIGKSHFGRTVHFGLDDVNRALA